MPPAGTVAETGETDMEKSVPVPVRTTLCGLPAALLVTVMLADRAPMAPGVKVVLKVQLEPAARLLAPNKQGDVPVAERTKSPALAPVTVILVRFNWAVPELVRVITVEALGTLTAWLPKFTLAGERLTAGAPIVPGGVPWIK